MIGAVSNADVFRQALRLVGKDWNLLNRLIYTHLRSDVPLVGRVAQYLLNSGGKRIRPMLLMLVARALGCAPGGPQVRAGVIVEYIHSATLLHDDVVDEAEMRRGKSAANVLHGSAASVLVGDFLYSRAFQLIVELLQERRAVEVLAATTNQIAEGEVMQLMNLNQLAVTEEQYLQVIQRKTASLFEACARIGAILAHRRSRKLKRRLPAMAWNWAWPTRSPTTSWITPAARRLSARTSAPTSRRGRPTLPLLHAMRVGSPAQQTVLRNALRTGGLENLPGVMRAIESTGALQYARRARARSFAARRGCLVCIA